MRGFGLPKRLISRPRGIPQGDEALKESITAVKSFSLYSGHMLSFPFCDPAHDTIEIAALMHHPKPTDTVQAFFYGLDICVSVAHEGLSQVIYAVADVGWSDLAVAVRMFV